MNSWSIWSVGPGYDKSWSGSRTSLTPWHLMAKSWKLPPTVCWKLINLSWTARGVDWKAVFYCIASPAKVKGQWNPIKSHEHIHWLCQVVDELIFRSLNRTAEPMVAGSDASMVGWFSHQTVITTPCVGSIHTASACCLSKLSMTTLLRYDEDVNVSN